VTRERPRSGAQIHLARLSPLPDAGDEFDVVRVRAAKVPDGAAESLLERLVMLRPKRFLEHLGRGDVEGHTPESPQSG